MTENRQEFAPLGSDTEIHLRQITEAEANGNTVAPSTELSERGVLKIRIPEDEFDVMVGILEGQSSGLTNLFAWWLTAALSIVILLFAVTVFAGIWRGKLSLQGLISEANGKASLSRFQALVFTFVLSGSLAVILAETGGFPGEIPWEIMAIMTGSLGTYLISKGIQSGGDATMLPEMSVPSGPILRFGKSKVTFDPSGISETSSPLSTYVPVTKAGPNDFHTVAVAVGTCRLKVSCTEPKGGLSMSEVSFVDANGALMTKNLKGVAELETAPDRVTEIRVRFQSAAESAAVPVRVESLN